MDDEVQLGLFSRQKVGHVHLERRDGGFDLLAVPVGQRALLVRQQHALHVEVHTASRRQLLTPKRRDFFFFFFTPHFFSSISSSHSFFRRHKKMK